MQKIIYKAKQKTIRNWKERRDIPKNQHADLDSHSQLHQQDFPPTASSINLEQSQIRKSDIKIKAFLILLEGKRTHIYKMEVRSK